MEIDLHLKFLALKVLVLPVVVTSLAFILFFLREWKGEREGQKHQLVASLTLPKGI